jgi:C_GCAxxG_C_C family probable redox protein
MGKAEKAVNMLDSGFNCTQAIFSSFGTDNGINESHCVKIGELFGGGIAHLGNVCGAVTGALMVIGLKHGRTKSDDEKAREKSHILAKQFLFNFVEKNGTILCKELINFDISTPTKIQEARDKNVFINCPGYVKTVAEMLIDLGF